MFNNKKVIGITGVAGAGKDTLFEVLRHIYKSKGKQLIRLSFGDFIKTELRDYIFFEMGIDLLRCSREDKEKIRPLIIFYSNFRRFETQGRYFCDLLEKQFKKMSQMHPNAYFCITDVRFKEFSYDEVDFLRKLDGFLIHLTMREKDGRTRIAKNYKEKLMNPILKKHSDLKIVWNEGMNFDEMVRKINKYES